MQRTSKGGGGKKERPGNQDVLKFHQASSLVSYPVHIYSLCASSVSMLYLDKKRFYTRETIRGNRISPLAEIPPLFDDWLRKGLIN